MKDLFYLFFFFGFAAKKFLEEFFLRSVLKSALYVFKKSSLKKFLLQNILRFFKSFSHIERNFCGHSPKELSSDCQNIPPGFLTIILKKKSRFFKVSYRIEQKELRLPSKTLGSDIVTSFCLSRGKFQWQTLLFWKKSFSPMSDFGGMFFWRWR